MVLTFKEPMEDDDLRARITVFGVGGAGGNAVNNMIEKQLPGVEFVAANTDAQALANSRAPRKIQLGSGVTRGLGAGSKPEVGYSAAEEGIEEILANLEGAHMCFITAGMGGGTGTGAAPVVARVAREMGILTVGVVTKPFHFEGSRRMKIAEMGVAEMQKVVDTLIVIPNQNLFQVASERTTFVEAFVMADDVLYQGVQGVTDLMVRPGMINLDFADVKSVMEEMGKAMMGTGEAEGETRAIDAAEKAIANPLLDEVSLKGAKGVLINITGGYDLTLFEMDEAANRIKDEVDAEALIKFGSSIDPEMEGKMRVSVVATGIDAESAEARPPVEAPARKRPVTTDPGMIAAVRGSAPAERPAPRFSATPARAEAPAPKPAAAPATTVAVAEPEPVVAEPEPVAEAPEPVEQAPSPQPVASRPVAAEPAPAPTDPLEGIAGTSPTPDDMRARAEEVRRRAMAAREERRREASAPPPTAAEQARFDLGESDLDPGSFQAEPEPEPKRSTFGNMRAPNPFASKSEEGGKEAGRGLFRINTLINRVAGGAQEDSRLDRGSMASEPRVTRESEAQSGEDEGEIPAFLRRQAN